MGTVLDLPHGGRTQVHIVFWNEDSEEGAPPDGAFVLPCAHTTLECHPDHSLSMSQLLPTTTAVSYSVSGQSEELIQLNSQEEYLNYIHVNHTNPSHGWPYTHTGDS